MNYFSAKEVAELWGISQRRVAVLCAEQRIPNVEMVGNMWLIPKGATKPTDGRSARTMIHKRMKPFIKWAGGKGQLIEEIKALYPIGFGDKIRRYAEPFVGGGAVLFDILNAFDLDEIYISDTNAELMNAYRVLRDNASELITMLTRYQTQYLPLDDDRRKDYYYEKRARFNELKRQAIPGTELAALFIFLNRTCFNGLYRVNAKGEFNVPMGAYQKPLICDEVNLRQVSVALSKVTIVCGDYRESNSFIDSNTFVYFDPPYRPLNATSNFTAYTENAFDDNAQAELAEYIHCLSARGAYIVASNSDPKNTNPHDNFFDELYSKMEIKRIYASRMINSNASSRGKISELLISSY